MKRNQKTKGRGAELQTRGATTPKGATSHKQPYKKDTQYL